MLWPPRPKPAEWNIKRPKAERKSTSQGFLAAAAKSGPADKNPGPGSRPGPGFFVRADSRMGRPLFFGQLLQDHFF